MSLIVITLEHKYLRGKLFLLEGKNHKTNSKSISLFSNQLQYFLCMYDNEKKFYLVFLYSHIYSLCVSWLKKTLLVFLCSYTHFLCVSRLKKKLILFFFTLTHTNYLPRMW